MSKSRWGMVLTAGIAAALLASCSSRHGFNNNSDCDYIIFPEIQDGATLPTATLACANEPVSISFDITVEFLGLEEGGAGEPPDPTILSNFMLEYYDVTYRNLTTGGSVQGVDVPVPFRQSIQSIIDMSEDEELQLDNFPLLQAGAKSAPPLNDDRFYPTSSGVVLEATVTFWGHPIQNDDAWCFATFRWIFSVVPC